MSIALSAVIRPSLRLRVLVAAYALCNLAAAAALGGAGALACLLAAAMAARACVQGEMTRRIDISGVGEIRLTVQQSMGSAGLRRCQARLLPGSTLWPQGMFLQLQDIDDGKLTVLTIWPDSVAPDQFREIAVALRAIAGRDNKFVETNKIL